MEIDRDISGIWQKRPVPQQRLYILCVEDNDGDFVLLKEHFSNIQSNHIIEIERAECIEDALDLIKRQDVRPFDVVLLDLSLPDSMGLETFDRIAHAVIKLPVIALSGNLDREIAYELVQRGGQDYLTKDLITPDSLMRTILYSIERKSTFNTLAKLYTKLKATTEELKTAQMELIQTEKLDSLGRLAAGVAHEVRNPLGALRMGLSYLKQREEDLDDPGFVIVFEEMNKAIERADTIIQGMVDYSRDESIHLVRSDTNELVRKSINFVNFDVIKNSIDIRTDFRPDIPSILIDNTKMEQVMINLITNAIHAVGEGGRIDISTQWGNVDDVEKDEGFRDFKRIRNHDEVVVIEVRDYGPGIPTDKLNRVFEPFYTTKPTGQGTGLGLSVVKRIIDLHRGCLLLQNVEEGEPGLSAKVILQAHQKSK